MSARDVVRCASVALLLALSWRPASAVVLRQGVFELSPTVGVAVPLGDFGDGAESGLAIGGQGAYYLSRRGAIGFAAVFNSFGVDEALEELAPNVDWDISIVEISGFWKALLVDRGTTAPYVKLLAGAFANEVAASTGGATVSVSETDVGVGGGLGVQFVGRGSVGGFMEVLIIEDFTEDDATQYATFRGGLSFFFSGTR